MDLNHEYQRLLTRRQFFGRTAAGIGTAGLASLLNPRLFAAEAGGSPALNPVTGGSAGSVLQVLGGE